MSDYLFISPLHISQIRKKPKEMHWSQSPLEKVLGAEILLDGRDFVFVRTDFSAPRLAKYSWLKTEDIGKFAKREYVKYDNLKSFDDLTRWFYTINLPESYQKGDFIHTDYTFYQANEKFNAFVSMRIYPKGSYFVDLINGNAELFGAEGARFTGASNSSFQGGDEEDNDQLNSEERTKTLLELTRINRFRQGKVILQTSSGDYEGNPDNDLFVNQDDLSSIDSLDLGDRIVNTLWSGELCENQLQIIFQRFKGILEECNVSYRR